MKKYAIISSDANPVYADFLPLTALFWRMVGYETICIVTEDCYQGMTGSTNERLRLVGTTLQDQKGVCLYKAAPVEGFKTSTVAQVSRLAALALPISDESYLITGDADMFPLSKTWFEKQDLNYSFHVFGADTCAEAARSFAMCYLGGTKAAWKSFMGFKSDDFNGAVKELLSGQIDHWCLDEGIIASKMYAWPLFDTCCERINRGGALGNGTMPHRLDRGYWKLPDDLGTLIDCHSARPLLAHWSLIERLVDYFLPASDREIVKSYVAGLRRLEVSKVSRPLETLREWRWDEHPAGDRQPPKGRRKGPTR